MPTRHESLARLRDLLANLYWNRADAERVARDAGLDLTSIAFDPTAANTWRSILQVAEDNSKIDELLRIVTDQYPRDKKLLDALAGYQYEGIFDRESLVASISRGSLEKERGPSSAAVVGAPKMGRTHVLDHLCSKRSAQNVLFCQINVYTLSASLRPGESLSDRAFLTFFLRRLKGQLDNLVERQAGHEAAWRQELTKTQKTLNNLRSLQQQPQPGLEIKIQALDEELRDLRTLRDVANRIEELLAQQTPPDLAQAVPVFERLQASRKRIVLVIDDFDVMLRTSEFSDALFQFLRGASNEGKIVTIVSSAVQLMDHSLHRVQDPRERVALVNHFQVQPLEPFEPDQADAFLDWLAPVKPELSPEEKNYLRELGGGFPYFLEQVRERFLARNRPGPDRRKEFEENSLEPSLRNAFQSLWDRCSPTERTVLRAVVSGESVTRSPELIKLKREGHVVYADGGLRPFSRLFGDFVRQAL